jgi:PAS domain S-box-containing protein
MQNTDILYVGGISTYNKQIIRLLHSYGYNTLEIIEYNNVTKALNEKDFHFIIIDLGTITFESIDSIKAKTKSNIIVINANDEIQKRNYLFGDFGRIEYFSSNFSAEQIASNIDTFINITKKKININILILDFCNETTKVIHALKSQNKFNIYQAKSVSEAIEISSKKIDIIFYDTQIKGEDGKKLLYCFKDYNEFKKIPSIAIVPNGQDEEYPIVIENGSIDFIKKPLNATELYVKCNLHIEQSIVQKKVNAYKKYMYEYQRILDESNIISKADLKGNITYVNQNFVNISGFSANELIGKSHNIIRHQDTPKDVFKNMWKKIQNKETFKGIIKNKRKDGTPYYVDASVLPILDVDGNISEYIGVRHDITDIMNAKKLFQDDISHAVEPLAFLSKIENYVLLKEFYGETFIQKIEDFVSNKLIELMPPYYKIKKIYHFDNGEFAFFKELKDTILDDVPIFLQNFQENLAAYDFIVDGSKMDINLSFSYTTQKNESFENLKIGILKAQHQKLGIVFCNDYASENKIKAKDNLVIVDMLKDVIENNPSRIISHFQPVYNNKTKQIEKYESLVRVQKNDGTLLSPFFFLEIAKRAGYYLDITNHILDNTFEALKQTDKEITINLSTLDIENSHIRNKILSLIVDPIYHGRVVFELLEDEAAKDFKTIQDFISVVKTVSGVKIAIDDFGAGYSNFERLLDFQPDILKIDGSLIKNIVEDSFSQHVVEAIVLFAKKENIQTVAEFVSDEKILKKVIELGIDYSQGFYIGKPAKL